jgi:hypothetical protein
LYEDQKRHFDAVPDDAKSFLATGESPRDEHLNVAEHAAMAVVAKTLLNFDECAFKR